MNIYKLNYYVYDIEDKVYILEREWTMRSDNSYEEMKEYADKLTKGLGMRCRNIFLVDEIIIQDVPDINDILEEIRYI